MDGSGTGSWMASREPGLTRAWPGRKARRHGQPRPCAARRAIYWPMLSCSGLRHYLNTEQPRPKRPGLPSWTNQTGRRSPQRQKRRTIAPVTTPVATRPRTRDDSLDWVGAPNDAPPHVATLIAVSTGVEAVLAGPGLAARGATHLADGGALLRRAGRRRLGLLLA